MPLIKRVWALFGLEICLSPVSSVATWGSIGRKYESMGGANSWLGLPTKAEWHDSDGTIWANFEKGWISTHKDRDHVVAYHKDNIGWKSENTGEVSGYKPWFGKDVPGYITSADFQSGLIIENGTYGHDRFRDAKLSGKFFNSGSTSGFVEVRDQENRLVDLKLLPGSQPPTDIVSSGVELLLKYPQSFFNDYSWLDSREHLDSQDLDILIPRGGTAIITKSSKIAMIYNIAMAILEMWKLKGSVESEILTTPQFTDEVQMNKFLIGFAKEYGKRLSTDFFSSSPAIDAMPTSYINKDVLYDVLQSMAKFATSNDIFGKTLPGTTLKVFTETFSIGVENALQKTGWLKPLSILVKGTRIGGDFVNLYALLSSIYSFQKEGSNGEMKFKNYT